MKPSAYFFKTALNHLRRGGQRNLIAFLCVVFGVMSLVAMTTLARSIEQMLVLKPVELIGADLTLDRANENFISAEEEAGLQEMMTSGKISDYTLMDYTTTLAFHRQGSNALVMPSYGMGVDPAKYPLAGNLTIAEPKNAALAQLLANAGDVIITKDLASSEKLSVGDPLQLSDLDYGISINAVIRGIASDTPNHQGSKVYFSHQTAQELMGTVRTSNTVLVNSPDPETAKTALETAGWRVFTATALADATAASEGMLAMMVNDIGLLGLLVGGIGIANTMHVLLKRREKEVAIWKSIGYNTRQIERMFLSEAAILGAAGSLVGVGLGVLLSLGITGLFSRITTVLVITHPSAIEALSGFIIGILTTLAFTLMAIVSSSQVPPLALLRHEEIKSTDLPKGKMVGLALFVGILFLAVTVWVLKSFLAGILVLAGTIFFLWIMGLILLGLVKLVLKLFKLKNWPLARIARNNLMKRSSSLLIAMVALFVGVEMLAIGAVISQSGSNVIKAINQSSSIENLAIYAAPGEESNVRAKLSALQITDFRTSHQYQVKQVTVNGQSDQTLSPIFFSRPDANGLTLDGDAWMSYDNAAYLPQYFRANYGDTLQVTLLDGSTVDLYVAGTYSTEQDIAWPGTADRILISDKTAQKLGTASSSQFYMSLDPEKLSTDTTALENALPAATVISMSEFQAHYARQYNNLFLFIAAMAGLAILAALLLIANSINLTMLDRRYEIGVFKSLGYSRGQIFLIQVLEYSLMALIVSLVGMGTIQLFLVLIRAVGGAMGSLLILTPVAFLVILLLTVGLTVLVVIASCWNPTKVSPILTFNDRE
jgi:putative ABC transport system permease protein